jgi:hypothetical protein
VCPNSINWTSISPRDDGFVGQRPRTRRARERLSTHRWIETSAACSQSSSSATTDGGAGDGPASSDLVAKCESLATSFAQICNDEYTGDAHTPDTERVCIWTTYAQICRTGNTQLLVDSMNCFTGNPSCWIFSDPNSAAACLASVHASGESAAARALLQDVCTRCGATSCSTTGQAELFPYVSDSEIAAIRSCLGTGCTNAELLANCTSVPDVSGIFACK